MKFATVNGVSLRYEISGEGGPVVVLVHEMGGSLESWEESLPLMTPGHTVLRYDQRGWGLSEKSDARFSIEDLVADLDALLIETGLEGPFVLAGGAVGGGVALAYAATHPQKVAGVVGFAPATGVPPERRAGSQARATKIEELGIREFVLTDTAPEAYPEGLRANRERFQRFIGLQLASDLKSYANMIRMLAEADFDLIAERLECPVLLVAGAHDAMRTPAIVGAYARRLKRGRTETADSGHFMAIHAPEIIAEQILRFASGL